ncbi:MAG TPA: FAD-binding oxidoreductase [Anaerolineae bacterium]|nr:FAD-binding oxidoreductase [Anaerolineae bacterium]
MRRGVQGDILAAPHEALHQYERNFGGMIRHTPRIVVRAICEQDIIHVLQTAQTNSVPVTIRGAGHSCMGQALSDDGILLVNAAAHASFTLLENGRVEITTRCRWKYVERILNQIGLTAPVLGDNLSITIGGILSVGGYGVRSVAYGAIVHQVERLRFIQPDGSPIWCSPTENTELFQYSLAGQGRIGFIERVVMRTIPYPRQTQHYTFKHTSLDSLVKSLAWLLNDAFPEEFIAIYSRAGTIVSHYEFSLQNIPANPIQQLSQGDKLQQTQVLPNISPIYRQLQITSDEFNPAVDYLIEYAQLQPFLDFIKDKLHQTCLGQYTDSFIVMAVRPPANQHPLPFEATAFGSDPIKFLVGFYPVVPKENIRALEKVKAIIRDILHLCIKLGGRPYLYGWHELDVQVKRKLYGTHYDAVLQLQQKLDPKNLFNKKVI